MGGDKPGKVPPASSIGNFFDFPKLEVTFSPLKKVARKKTPLKRLLGRIWH